MTCHVSPVAMFLLQGEGEHHKGEFPNELQQLGKPENLHPGTERLQQGEVNLGTDAEGHGGRSKRPTLRLQEGVERMQEVRGPVNSLHCNVQDKLQLLEECLVWLVPGD